MLSFFTQNFENRAKHTSVTQLPLASIPNKAISLDTIFVIYCPGTLAGEQLLTRESHGPGFGDKLRCEPS